ncbi:MAG: TetR/AcrR family transcriptional regulator [Alphaproteobacteria bacterium]|nr:TetR/AcrR family transcriptional regulator [Alphaproteobacteria bacterium]MBU6473675.1 TetR/AcrR family transcriptional regulator [Alphaproteobacteria bacterium]MDE2012074.1 TetR/AcrR family transcriptional regulator [Alphaproteobacteria bacterium]MDE2073370.1 TetR/AcrR family transcriptional regulator [Alphaproteobacteria bacterium]
MTTSELALPRVTPRSRRKLDQILQAARQLFFKQGFAATTMEAVAKEAGVSKATLYAYFKSREMLFGAAVGALDNHYTASLISGATTPGDIREKLLRFAKDILELLLHPQTIAAYRTVVSESARFPEISEAFYVNGARRLLDRLEGFFAAAMATGALRSAPPDRAAEQFIGVIRGDLMLRALLSVKSKRENDDADAIIASGVDVFYRAYRPEESGSGK